jgi:hypothetical protein
MKERPIPFSGKMVRAILEGRKTQTRRVIKPQPTLNFHYHGWYMKDAYEWTTCHPLEVRHPKSQRQVVRCPPMVFLVIVFGCEKRSMGLWDAMPCIAPITRD